MSEQTNHPINPFEAAKRRSGIAAQLNVRDVQVMRPDWDERRAAAFLERHAAVIAKTMLIAGAKRVRELLEDDHAD